MKTVIYIAIVCIFGYCCNRQPKSLHDQLIGKWGWEGSPVWEIRTDSIYYFEEKKAYAYILEKNQLTIKRQENDAILRNITVNEDTLSFTDDLPQITTYAHRVK